MTAWRSSATTDLPGEACSITGSTELRKNSSWITPDAQVREAPAAKTIGANNASESPWSSAHPARRRRSCARNRLGKTDWMTATRAIAPTATYV